MSSESPKDKINIPSSSQEDERIRFLNFENFDAKEYASEIIRRAKCISKAGSNELSFSEAANLISRQAQKFGILYIDIVDAMNDFKSIPLKYNSNEFDASVIASALYLGESLILADFEHRALDTISRVSQEENVEYELFDFSSVSLERDSIKILSELKNQLSRCPKPGKKWRLLILKGVSNLSNEIKAIITSAMVSRKIGDNPVPYDVKIIILENSDFSVDSIPSEIVMRSICYALSSENQDHVVSVTNAYDKRMSDLSDSLEKAKFENNLEKIKMIEELLKKPIYIPAANDSSGFNSRLSLKCVDLLAQSSDASNSEYKANIIMDVTSPEKSEFARKIAEKLLIGVHGNDFAENHLKNYLSANFGGNILPRLEDVALGYRSISEIEKVLVSGNMAYLTDLAIQLRTSSAIDMIMKRGGDGAIKLNQVFLLLFDVDPQMAEGVALDRPYFIS